MRTRVADPPPVGGVDYVNRPTPRGQPLAAASRNRKLVVLSGFFAFLKEKGHASADPTAGVPWSRLTRSERPALTGAEIGRLLRATERARSPWAAARDAALVSVLFHVGLRLAELVALDVDQVDLRAGLLLGVKRKGGNSQPLPLNESARNALSAWLEVRGEATSSALLLSQTRGRLSRRAVEARVATLGRVAGFSFNVSPHMLRHGFATEILAAGANLEEVRRLLGHTSILTTSRYLHPDGKALRAAVNRLSRPARRRGGDGTGKPEGVEDP
ncbi:tyrosine-type recombinase/integrase [Candidatus Uhrbacteria bacterium]|nr:tyrosine-type recombinase/integrase [Candidatus Uhrbacteria bacterium]